MDDDDVIRYAAVTSGHVVSVDVDKSGDFIDPEVDGGVNGSSGGNVTCSNDYCVSDEVSASRAVAGRVGRGQAGGFVAVRMDWSGCAWWDDEV